MACADSACDSAKGLPDGGVAPEPMFVAAIGAAAADTVAMLCGLVTVALAVAGEFVPLPVAALLDAAETAGAGLVTAVFAVVAVEVCEDGDGVAAAALVCAEAAGAAFWGACAGGALTGVFAGALEFAAPGGNPIINSGARRKNAPAHRINRMKRPNRTGRQSRGASFRNRQNRCGGTLRKPTFFSNLFPSCPEFHGNWGRDGPIRLKSP